MIVSLVVSQHTVPHLALCICDMRFSGKKNMDGHLITLISNNKNILVK